MKRPRAISAVRSMSISSRRAVLLVTALCVGSAGAGFAVASEPRPVAEYAIPTGSITSVRPTGVGLPEIGETGTVGAGEIVSALRKYDESGEYEADLAAVDGAAEAYLNERVATGASATQATAASATAGKAPSAIAGFAETSSTQRHASGTRAAKTSPSKKRSSKGSHAKAKRHAKSKGKRVCKTVYRRARRTRKGVELYRRVERCHRAPRRASEEQPTTSSGAPTTTTPSGTTPGSGESSAPVAKGKPALVLDIDETSLSNYSELAASGFTEAGVAAGAVAGTDPAIAPTLKLYHDAIKHGVAVFFVTGRPQEISAITESNLEKAGYDEGWAGIAFKPSSEEVVEFKAAERKSIEQSGYDIVANVGDQQSDLEGGYADRDFKLPDPFYFIAN